VIFVVYSKNTYAKETSASKAPQSWGIQTGKRLSCDEADFVLNSSPAWTPQLRKGFDDVASMQSTSLKACACAYPRE
jgi:hypothetical protein